jgi:hypothetical protein
MSGYEVGGSMTYQPGQELFLSENIAEEITEFYEEQDATDEKLEDIKVEMLTLMHKNRKVHKKIWGAIYKQYPDLEGIHCSYNKVSKSVKICSEGEDDTRGFLNFLKGMFGQ